MAGEIKPIFSKEAEAQLNKINSEISLIYDNVKELDKIKLDFKSFKGYQKAVEEQEKSTEKLTASQKKLEKATENLSFAQSEEGKELARLRQLTNQQNKENREAAKDATTAAEGYDRLRIELTKAEKKYRDLASTQGLASAETKKAQKQVQELRQEIDDINEPIGRFNDNVGNYASAIPGFDRLNGALSGLGVNLDGIAAGSGGVKSAFATIGSGLASATRAGLAFIATPIGAAIAALAAVGLAAKAFFDFNVEIAETNILVERLANTTGAATDKLREQATAIESAYGKDFNEAVRELADLQRDFGVSSEEAFEIYNDGLARGGAASGEFGDSIREYGQLFAANGFSAQEFIDILNTGIDLGIYNDKLPDAIKEAGISLNEQTKATREALVNAFGASFTADLLDKVNSGAISIKDALNLIAQESEKVGLNQEQLATLTADVFRGAGEDAGGAQKIFEALNQSVNLTDESLSDLSQAQKETAGLLDELEAAQTRAFKSDALIAFNAALKNTWIGIKIGFFNAISFVSDTITEGIGYIKADFASLSVRIQSIPAVFKAVFQDVIRILQDVANNAVQYGQVIEKAFRLDFQGAKDQLKGIEAVNFELKNTKKIQEETESAARFAYLNSLKQTNEEKQSIKELNELKKEGATAGGGVTGGGTDGGGTDGDDGESDGFDVSAAIKAAGIKNAQALAEEQNKLSDKFKNSQIGSQEFIDGLSSLQKQYNAELISDTIETLEKIIEVENLTDDERKEALETLADFRIDLQKNNVKTLEELAKEQAKKEQDLRDQEAKAKDKQAEDDKKRAESVQQAKQIITELGFEALTDITNEFFDRQSEKNAAELAKFEEEQNKRLEYVNQLEADGAITEEEASARRIRLEEETAKKQTEIKRKQAIQDKAQALFNIAVNTAQAAIASLAAAPLATALGPNPAGIAALAAVLAQGTIQAAIVASRPIPEFYKGTDYSPEGLAFVGERGAELIEYPDGTQRIAAQKTLEYLPEGTKVKTAEQTRALMNDGLKGEIKGLRSDLKRKKMSVNIDVRNNSRIEYLGL
tara:strand:- start:3413 stop:6556 length:3144 start_codon:yes stop_codon:yes gene_type:complete